MVNARDDQPLTRLEVLVLARASDSKTLKEEALAKTVFELALPNESPARAREVALETFEVLSARGLVKKPSRTRKGNVGSKLLTDEGRRALRSVFGLTRVPTWSQVRDYHLPALALGLKPGSVQAKAAVSSEDAITATVLRGKLGIEHAPTVADLCDALIAEVLGMSPGKLTLGKIRAHVLARRSGVEVKGELDDIAARVVAVELHARGGGKDAIDAALGRRWLGEVEAGQVIRPAQPVTQEPQIVQEPLATHLSSVAPERSDRPQRPVHPVAPIDPPQAAPAVHHDASAALLEIVREAIPRVGAAGRFGDEKVFVSALWRNMEQDRRLSDLSLDRFKRWLVRANRDGWLVLVRADLVGAMDAKLVADSEIEDHGATFHFVLDSRRAVAASERGTHVR